MAKHYLFQISLVTLILCLCLGILVVLPIGNIVGVLGPEIYGVELENDNLFEQGESDEEFIIKIHSATSDYLLSLQSRSTNLNFQDSLLTPVSPPPEHA